MLPRPRRPGPCGRPLRVAERRGFGGSIEHGQRLAVLALGDQGIAEAELGRSVGGRGVGAVQQRATHPPGGGDPVGPHEAAGLLDEHAVAAGIGRAHGRDRPLHEVGGDIGRGHRGFSRCPG